ncbi:MAG: hypothetical protein JO003_04040 [Candidatus Eremiobacteraeota bacterium]|nr:hypothetical protein [Candidatus Eremiobacteraeota bacterium]
MTGFTPPTGECVDRAGDVFVVTENTSESAGVIYEYAHGGTEPIATLNDPNYAFGCSVDPTTGNLAVSGEGVAIYKNATGSPTVYSSSEFGFLYCGYDDAGNLYLTASKSNSGTERFLVRLAIGSGSFEAISFGKKLYADTFFEPSTQWDGTRMTVSTIPEYLNGREQGPEYVYRLNISGSVAKIAGVTRLSSKKSAPAGQNWIQGERIAAAYYYRSFGHVGVWPYPRGGAPRRRISHILARGEIWGVAVSPGTGSSTALAR